MCSIKDLTGKRVLIDAETTPFRYAPMSDFDFFSGPGLYYGMVTSKAHCDSDSNQYWFIMADNGERLMLRESEFEVIEPRSTASFYTILWSTLAFLLFIFGTVLFHHG